jgi:hypothetical protein
MYVYPLPWSYCWRINTTVGVPLQEVLFAVRREAYPRVSLPWRSRKHVPPKRRFFLLEPHGTISQKTTFFIVPPWKISQKKMVFDPTRLGSSPTCLQKSIYQFHNVGEDTQQFIVLDILNEIAHDAFPITNTTGDCLYRQKLSLLFRDRYQHWDRETSVAKRPLQLVVRCRAKETWNVRPAAPSCWKQWLAMLSSFKWLMKGCTVSWQSRSELNMGPTTRLRDIRHHTPTFWSFGGVSTISRPLTADHKWVFGADLPRRTDIQPRSMAKIGYVQNIFCNNGKKSVNH